MRRRSLLMFGLAGAIGLSAMDSMEAAVKNFLYFDQIDDDLFSELQPGAGNKGINARVLQPPGDSRLPDSARRPVLLLVFRLDEPPPPKGPEDKMPGWQIEFALAAGAAGAQLQTIDLLPKPMDGNHNERATRDPNLPPLPGAIYRGAIWADLTELYKNAVFRPGMDVEIRFGQQMRTRVKLP